MSLIAEALAKIRPGAQWALIGDDYAGLTWLDASAKPSENELSAAVSAVAVDREKSAYSVAIQAHIDATAKSKGYADGVALASYITSTIPSWQAEAAVFVPWRDSVWLAAYTTLGAVQGGATPPTIEQLIASLPPITWPT